MKVLFVYQDYGAMGGIERYLLQTASWLRERGNYEPVLACTENSPLYQQLKAAGFTVYGLPNHPIFASSILRTLDMFTLFRLHRILRTEKPGIVHVHIGLVENLVFKALGFPVVYTFHGYSTLYSRQGIQPPLKRLFKAMTCRLFQKTVRGLDALVFVSQAEQQRMQTEGYLPHDQAGQILYNGLPIEQWQTEVAAANPTLVRQTLGLPENAQCISFINRLDENKNPLQFIELDQRLESEASLMNDSPLHFLIAGDGPLAPEIIQACNTHPNLHYLGYRSDVAQLLAITDLLVHPARREGFGLGLVEAMAAGVPCIAYASGGAQEILDTPETRQCLVPVDDAETLYQRTRTFLQMTATEKQLLKAALQARAQDFDREPFIQGLESIYRQVAPKVSVILPVYNGEAIVRRAVQSVLNQTYQNLELIVVDDSSSDGTLELLSTIQDDRLIVISQANQGVAAARNHGFSHATGNYIAFIDADDVWLKRKLEAEWQTIRRNGNPVCLVYSSYYAVDEQDRLINLPGIYRDNGDLSQAVLEHEGIFLPSTALVHRSVFQAVGGFKPACYHEDRVFFIEACRQFPAYATEQRLVMYRQSLSGRCRSVLKHYEQALEAELSIVETLRPVLSNEEIAVLSIRQMRNLLYRFLMYNYTPQAQQLYRRLQAAESTSDLFGGKKGQLALLSLKTGINFLAGARLLFQSVTKHLLNPWWRWTFHAKADLSAKPLKRS
ncbi:MAG: putative glycosyltransferase [Vampirovibrio sp.]|jgi:glycosyltransferase involved in cell wall biosynthesis|nr:putative glycosyltransferase [Vampirovibrio sp.]